jgi:hypothetical protein
MVSKFLKHAKRLMGFALQDQAADSSLEESGFEPLSHLI